MEISFLKRDWVALAGALGLIGTLLFTNAQGGLLPEWGPNLLVWILLALSGLIIIARRSGVAFGGDGRWFALPLCFFAASFFLREDSFLRFWNGVFLLVSAALLAMRCRGSWRAAMAGYTEYVRLCALAAVFTLISPFSLLFKRRQPNSEAAGGTAPPRVVLPNSRLGSIGKIAPLERAAQFTVEPGEAAQLSAQRKALEHPGHTRSGTPAAFGVETAAAAAAATTAAVATLPKPGLLTPTALLKGILLSALPLAVFGALFASADPVFGHLWSVIFDWNFSALAGRIAWGIALGWIGVGLLCTAVQREPIADQVDLDLLADGSPAPRRLTALFGQCGDVLVALVLIDLLFAVFVAVQFSFLFGGESVIRSVPGLNYASYGRGGFFELAWVAGLALPVMLLAHWLTRVSPDVVRRRVRHCTGLLTLLLLVIVASAFKRMALYEMAWGLTEKRVLVSVFIGAISVVFFWFLATAWRNRPQRFAVGLLCAAMLTIGGLDLFNTDAWVVQVDAHRARGLADFDATYLEGLGTDAAPALATSIGRATPAEQPVIARFLLDGTRGWNHAKSSDWRLWNASDAAADQAVKARQDLLAALVAAKLKQSSAISQGNSVSDAIRSQMLSPQKATLDGKRIAITEVSTLVEVKQQKSPVALR